MKTKEILESRNATDNFRGHRLSKIGPMLACNRQASGKDKEALEFFSKALKLKKRDKQIT